MKPMDALRVGTIYGAESIGLAKQIGSLEAGKFADLIVLDANPLDDIRNTNTIRYVDEERARVRRQHAERGVAAAASDAEAVVDDA